MKIKVKNKGFPNDFVFQPEARPEPLPVGDISIS